MRMKPNCGPVCCRAPRPELKKRKGYELYSPSVFVGRWVPIRNMTCCSISFSAQLCCAPWRFIDIRAAPPLMRSAHISNVAEAHSVRLTSLVTCGGLTCRSALASQLRCAECRATYPIRFWHCWYCWPAVLVRVESAEQRLAIRRRWPTASLLLTGGSGADDPRSPALRSIMATPTARLRENRVCILKAAWKHMLGVDYGASHKTIESTCRSCASNKTIETASRRQSRGSRINQSRGSRGGSGLHCRFSSG